jgi:homoserine O-succinyltransferase/O-acetyltransferase
LENKIKVVVLDMYNGEKNNGIRGIRDILCETDCRYANISVEQNIFEVRSKLEIPKTDFDIYISSGGPGNPHDGDGSAWESKYFHLLDELWTFNHNNTRKKNVFFICYSFQLMARYFKLGEVSKRHSKSFVVKPIHLTEYGKSDLLLEGLGALFYAADSREWQVVQPNQIAFEELGAKILCLEKHRPHVAYERAMMSVRINNEFVGVQFHPEKDSAIMYNSFRDEKIKEQALALNARQQYQEMLNLLESDDGIRLTRKKIIPNFLNSVIVELTN